MKKLFEDELILNMQRELHKRASEEQPDLVKAVNCLHAALEIFEAQGMSSKADQVLQILEKLGKNIKLSAKTDKIVSLSQLMQFGITQRDLREFTKGNPIAIAKTNIVLRTLGMSDHDIKDLLGSEHIMSEEDSLKAINPNEFKSMAKKQKTDRHTKGLTSEKQIENLKNHGTVFNMADAGCAVDVPSPPKKHTLTKNDMDADFTDLLNVETFDIDASDDELMGIEIKEDFLEVFDKEIPIEDFEDERN